MNDESLLLFYKYPSISIPLMMQHEGMEWMDGDNSHNSNNSLHSAEFISVPGQPNQTKPPKNLPKPLTRQLLLSFWY
jgi:hypothetical protein